jgi:hypothetical protein
LAAHFARGAVGLVLTRRRKSADPAADDQNPRCPRHLHFLRKIQPQA